MSCEASTLLWIQRPTLAVTPVVSFINCRRSRLVWRNTLELGHSKFQIQQFISKGYWGGYALVMSFYWDLPCPFLNQIVISRSFSKGLMNSKNTVCTPHSQKPLPMRTTRERMYISVGVFLTSPFTFIHLADALFRDLFGVLWGQNFSLEVAIKKRNEFKIFFKETK